jgi:excisionase family DNA binding protein
LLKDGGGRKAHTSTNLHAVLAAPCAGGVQAERLRRALSVDQVADLLGCSTAHVYGLVKFGKLEAMRTSSNALRFDCRTLGRALGLRTRKKNPER